MCKAIDDMMKDAREEERKVMQKKLDKYEKEIEELKRQLAERQTA